MSFARLSSLLLVAVSVSAYTWPNPKLDELESYLYDQRGYNERGILLGALVPCDAFNFPGPGDTTNRSNAADWIRTVRCRIQRDLSELTVFAQAYHDMATHNIEDETGGLDASIQFEQDRPEVCCSVSKLGRIECMLTVCACRMLARLSSTA